jgi:outer membrane lipoprotein SlyB
MPVGNELGNFEAKFTSVRTVAINGDEVVTEGSFMGKVSGQLAGTVTGTTTFTGTATGGGTMTGLSVGYLDSGDVLPGKTQGVYWSTSTGNWETRAAVMLPDANVVVEGQITLADGEFTWSGKIFELT